MTWFKVDDKAHANTKIRNVLATCPAALSLWTVAGSWVADELNDGFVPDSQLPWLMPAGAEELAQALVAARLWRRVRGGYQFHEWHKDGDGTKRNPTREEVLTERRKKADAGRLGGLARSANRKRDGNEKKVHTIGDRFNRRPTNGRDDGEDEPRYDSTSGKARSKTQAGASASATAGAEGLLEPPTRPFPSKEGSLGARPASLGAARSPEPPDRSPTDVDNPDWRRLRAAGVEPDPAELHRRSSGYAAASAAIRKPANARERPGPVEAARQRGTSLDPLDQALAEVIPLHPEEVPDVEAG